MEQLLRVGVISSTHGVRGEVKVYPTTDDVNRFKKLKNVVLDTGKDLLVNREDAVALEENENYVADLIDLKVVTDEGQVLGVLTEVMETGANDVYVVETEDGKELLLPAIRDCILDVDLETEVMTVHILPGLLD